MRNKKEIYVGAYIRINKCLKIVRKKIIFRFVFALTFPGVAYQPHSSMTVSAAFVA